MPSRHLLSSSSASSASPPFPSISVHFRSQRHFSRSILTSIYLSITLAVVVLLPILFYLLYWRRHRLSAPPNPNPNPNLPTSLQRLSASLLRLATSSFSPSNKLGHGGFGPVYRGLLPASSKNKELERPRPVAIKLMDSSSLQGDREFLNELSLSSLIPPSPFVLLPFAFSLSSPKPYPPFPFSFSCFNRGKDHLLQSDRSCMMLVYDLMPNGSLQDALLGRKSQEIVTSWPHRFLVALDVARALCFLHEVCTPPVIHGDVKPSNVLLDSNFRAKLADFGLARERSDSDKEEQEEGEERDELNLNDGASELATTNGDVDMDESNPAASPLAESTSKTNGGDGSTKEWWWRQDDSRSTNSKNVDAGTANDKESDPGVKKDYVMEWIRSEIQKERPKKEWWAPTSKPINSSSKSKELDKTSRRPSREWWREEFTEELSKKHKKKTLVKSRSKDWWFRDTEYDAESNSSRRKQQTRSWSRPSIDRWGDRTNCSDHVIPRSGATVSSTPSMRGTVCYVAPEYGGGGPVSEKCDMYSFGVLLLVIVSGRRPLQVAPAASPAAEFERASLVSWARHLAHMGRLVELVDPGLKDNIGPVEWEQLLLCVTVALLCIQRNPTRRPGAGEVVRILCGEAEAPHLPVEFSPSPSGGGFFKGRRKKAG